MTNSKEARKSFEKKVESLKEVKGIIGAKVKGKAHSTITPIFYDTTTEEGCLFAEEWLLNFQSFEDRALQDKEKYTAFLIERGVPKELFASRGPKTAKALSLLKKDHDSDEGLAIKIIDCINDMFHENNNHMEKLKAAFEYGQFQTLLKVYQRSAGPQTEKASKERDPELNKLFRKYSRRKESGDTPKELWHDFVGSLESDHEYFEKVIANEPNPHNVKSWSVSFTYLKTNGGEERRKLTYESFTRKLNGSRG